ncbi:uncharacterized protein AB9X84_014192 isoform 1-T1 [Acanthopagrus schlegelii]
MTRRYFLRCVILSDILFFSLVAGQSPRYELRGQKVSLKPDIPGRPENILWKRNGNKVVEFNGQEQEAYGQYENRVSLDWHTAELEITDLRFEDSGDYELEVYMNKKLSTSLHKLEVIDRVAKPNISCEMNDGGSSNKSGTLLCTAEPRQPQSLMKFEWHVERGKVQPGTTLTISLGDEYDDEVYICEVRNPLSEETTKFTAKDCYPENNSVLIGVLIGIAVLSLFVMGLGIFCCKQHNKVCFAKGNRQDSEQPGATEGSDEREVLIDRTPTRPSSQRLIQGSVRNKVELFESSFRGGRLPISFPAEKNKDENEETGPPPSTPHSESHSPLDPSNAATNDKGDADAEQLSELAEEVLQHHDSSDSEKENELKPADVSTKTMSPLELSSASEHQDSEKDEEGKSPPANVVTPVPKPRSQLPQNSPNIAPEGTTGGQKEDANSNQVNGETDTSGVGEGNESGASGEDENLSPVSEQKDSETTQHDQDPNLTQSETHTSEDNQQEMDKQSGSEGNSEEPDLYSASSHQPQSSTPTKPDNRSNDTFQESPDVAHEKPGQQGEGETTKESEESGESEDDNVQDKK